MLEHQILSELQHLNRSPMIRRPATTIAWGIVIASFVLALVGWAAWLSLLFLIAHGR